MAKAYIQQQIRQRGKAGVVVMLGEGTRSEEYLGRVADCFEHSEVHQFLGAQRRAPALILRNLGVIYGQVSKAGYEKLQGTVAEKDEITGTAPMQPIRSLGSDAAPPTTPQIAWGVDHIQAPALWKQGLSGKGVLVAHLDTGVDGSHPALKDAVQHFASFDLTGHPIENAPVADSGDHGSHTAGIIAGRTFLGQEIGVAPGCQLASAIVIENGDLVARVLAGVDWILGFPVRVLNLSLGVRGYFDHYVPLLQKLRDKGVFPVFAVGNEGPGISCSPANYPMAISVGAVDQNGAVDDQSSSETFKRKVNPLVPDLVMPGIDIVSVNAGGGNFRLDSGTSMAAPHLAGLAALLCEAVPAATVDQLQAAIYASCSLESGMPKTRANRGLADGPKALAALQRMVAVPKVAVARS